MRICLIGATHFCQNPRLLREADSLSEAGHDVRVISPAFVPALDKQDRRQLGTRTWRHERINYLPQGVAGSGRSVFIRGRRRLASALHQKLGGQFLAEHGYVPALFEQRRMASRAPVDWFIAHAHATLPAAAAAAEKWNARLGFDCEDLLSERQTDPVAIIRSIEKKYLRKCDYISTPSLGIAHSLQREYGIRPPLVLYNVFPLSLANGMLPPRQRARSGPVKLHWFSQTIGPGRGIEDAISACGMLKDDVELHLRGSLSQGYEDQLLAMSTGANVRVKLHPPVDHDQLIRTMDQFDVGLALERDQNIGAALTVSNKIGSYLMAGLAIAATDTPGQKEVLDQIQGAGFMYPSGKAELLAHGLRAWIEDRDSLLAAQEASWEAARTEWNWDAQTAKFFSVLS